jgi:hypothetical protein
MIMFSFKPVEPLADYTEVYAGIITFPVANVINRSVSVQEEDSLNSCLAVNCSGNVGFEVFTAVPMKSTASCVVTPSGSVDVHRCASEMSAEFAPNYTALQFFMLRGCSLNVP